MIVFEILIFSINLIVISLHLIKNESRFINMFIGGDFIETQR